jgi:hypothetical protein
MNVLPMTTVTITVKVWGSRVATRHTLMNVGLQIASLRLATAYSVDGFGQSPLSAVRTDHSIGQDVNGKFVQVMVSKTGPMPAQFLNFAPEVGAYARVPALSRMFPENAEDTGNVLVSNGAAYPVPNNQRGTFLHRNSIAAQIFLTDFSGTPSPALREELPTDASVRPVREEE